MTGSPAEQLAAARSNVVGPFLPAQDGWLKGWTGPVQVRRDHPDEPDGIWDDGAWREDCTDSGLVVTEDHSRIRLDTRRPEVQHLLCDLGVAPEWARKHAVACWCAGVGVPVTAMLDVWALHRTGACFDRVIVLPRVRRAFAHYLRAYTDEARHGSWGLHLPGFGDVHDGGGIGGPTGAIGRACADVAALRARCILTEPDGYYVPLADGGIGWWGHG